MSKVILPTFFLMLKIRQRLRLSLIIKFLSGLIGILCSPSVLTAAKMTEKSYTLLSIFTPHYLFTSQSSLVTSFSLSRTKTILAFHTPVYRQNTAFCDNQCVHHSLVTLQGISCRDIFACLFANTVK